MNNKAWCFMVSCLLFTISATVSAATSDFDRSVGSLITLGCYEQDNDLTNGPEEIEWIVLANDDERTLLISRYGLDSIPVNEEYAEVTWETCSLRSWLNKEFYQSAFTTEEKSYIEYAIVSTEDNKTYDTPGGSDTLDKLFVLSLEEIYEYFAVDAYNLSSHQSNELKAKGTEYAGANGVILITEEALVDLPKRFTEEDLLNCVWWLRTPGANSKAFTFVSNIGSVGDLGHDVTEPAVAVRPAMWVSFPIMDLQ